MSLTTGLVEIWDFAGDSNPAGSSVAGLKDGLALTLRRTARTTGGSSAVSAGWVIMDGKRFFNGQGFVELDAPLPLTAAGHAMTLVCWWSGLPPTPVDYTDLSAHILGAVGVETAPTEHGVWLSLNPTLTDSAHVRQSNVDQGGETSWSDSVSDPASTSTLATEHVFVAVFKVNSPAAFYTEDCDVDIYCDGIFLGTVVADNHVESGGGRNIDADKFTFGDLVDSQGGFRRCAIYSRALTPTEIADIDGPAGDDLVTSFSDEEAGLGTINPLLNSDGRLGINIEWPVARTVADAGVLVSPGERSAAGRHTREQHERGGVRTYEFRFNVANANDVERIRQALTVTRGGAAWTRFRHPIDDPAPTGPTPVKDAPRVRIVAVTGIERGRGGHVGSGSFTVEYV